MTAQPYHAFMGVDMAAGADAESWALEIGVSGWRVYVTPTSGRRPPYRMNVLDPHGVRAHQKIAVGLASIADAVDEALHWMRRHGLRVDRRAADDLATVARRMDADR